MGYNKHIQWVGRGCMRQWHWHLIITYVYMFFLFGQITTGARNACLPMPSSSRADGDGGTTAGVVLPLDLVGTGIYDAYVKPSCPTQSYLVHFSARTQSPRALVVSNFRCRSTPDHQTWWVPLSLPSAATPIHNPPSGSHPSLVHPLPALRPPVITTTHRYRDQIQDITLRSSIYRVPFPALSTGTVFIWEDTVSNFRP